MLEYNDDDGEMETKIMMMMFKCDDDNEMEAKIVMMNESEMVMMKWIEEKGENRDNEMNGKWR